MNKSLIWVAVSDCTWPCPTWTRTILLQKNSLYSTGCRFGSNHPLLLWDGHTHTRHRWQPYSSAEANHITVYAQLCVWELWLIWNSQNQWPMLVAGFAAHQQSLKQWQKWRVKMSQKMVIFVKVMVWIDFQKNDHFSFHFWLILKPFFFENEPKMAQKWQLWTTLLL